MKLTVVFDIQGIDSTLVDPRNIIEAITGESVGEEFIEPAYDGQGTIMVESAEWKNS